MLPSWIITTAVIIAGCITAYVVGSQLPILGDPWFSMEIVFIAIIGVLCAVYNSFPLLYAIGVWLPLAGFRSVPNVTMISIWIAAVLFFRLCLKGSIKYVRSFDWLPLIILSWVVVRFLMNPVTKLGATIGGTGVSGAMPYFLYVNAAALYVFIGAVLPTREKVMKFFQMQLLVVSIIGCVLFVCVFIPATAPVLHSLGFFNAGELGDGIQRIVVLPGYGLFMATAALCPRAFRLNPVFALLILVLGVTFMIIGGNRSAIASLLVAAPIVLTLRKKFGALFASVGVVAFLVVAMRVSVANLAPGDIPPMLRSFGMFDSKIEEASGGTQSAQWRYDVWKSGEDEIMEHPLVGKGFGNLPQRLDPTAMQREAPTDFEAVLAGGLAHNGFIVAAYGFGLPFMVLLTGCLAYYIFTSIILTLTTDPHDRELRDAYAFLACGLCSTPIIIYSAADLVAFLLDASLVVLLMNLQRRATSDALAVAEPSIQGYGNQPYATAPYRY